MLTVRSGTRITIHSLRRADLAVSAIETNAPSSAGGVYLTILFTRPPRSLNRVSTRSPLTSADRPILVAEESTRSPGGPYSDCILAVARALCKLSRMNLLHALRGIGLNTRSETPGPTHAPTW